MSVKELLATAFRTLSTALVAGSVVAVAACGGGGSPPPVARATPTAAGATPPASLASITAAPGVPTAPPPGPSPTAVQAVGTILSSPPAATPTPGPTVSGPLLDEILDDTLPASYWQSAFAAEAPPAPTHVGILGTITSFTPNGFVLAPAQLMTPANVGNKPDAINTIPSYGDGKSPVTVKINGSTFVQIQGGLPALRTGEAVTVTGPAAQPSNDFVADSLVPIPDGDEGEPTAAPALAIRSSVHSESSGVQTFPNAAKFTLVGKHGFPRAINFGVNVGAYSLWCTTYSLDLLRVNADAGDMVNLPLVLADTTPLTPYAFQVGHKDHLPLALLRGLSTSTYTYYVGEGLTFTFGLHLHDACGTTPDSTMTIVQIGSRVASYTQDGFPNSGDPLLVLQNESCGNAWYVNVLTLESLGQTIIKNASVSLCPNYAIQGNQTSGSVAVENVKDIDLHTPASLTLFFSFDDTGGDSDPLKYVIPQPGPRAISTPLPAIITASQFQYGGHLFYGLSGNLSFANQTTAVGSSVGGLTQQPSIVDQPNLQAPTPIMLTIKPVTGQLGGGIH